MARFVLFMASNGQERRINPDHVVEIAPVYGDRTLVVLSNGGRFEVRTSVDEVRAKLSAR